jgi:hypothetical protein
MEKDVKESKFNNFAQALWWGVVSKLYKYSFFYVEFLCLI